MTLMLQLARERCSSHLLFWCQRKKVTWSFKLKGLLASIRFFKKCAILALFFCYFCLFQTNITILTTNKREKCSCWDSNLQPSEHGSPPITTRPGLPPPLFVFLIQFGGNNFLTMIEGWMDPLVGKSWPVSGSSKVWTRDRKYVQSYSN